MDIPLCVDLDGTLIKTDMLFETFLLLIKKNPFYLVFCLWWWVSGGKAYLKEQIANRVQINPALLPYSQNFLSFLKDEKSKGRQLILATASNKGLANSIANYLGIFSEVIASDGVCNLRGKAKRDVLNQKFGQGKYDYAGNSKDDLKVWGSARSAILVNPDASVLRQSKKMERVAQVFASGNQFIRTLPRLLRVHQYVKNILVFTPLIVGHLFNASAIINSCLAFVVFCLLASSAYMLNDLLDLEADRQHRTKRNRPFASGDTPLIWGLLFSPLFFVIGCGLALFLAPEFFICVIAYYFLTIFYSFYFKKKMLVDVFVLAMLYTVRIIAGIAAVHSDYSPWLISFSIFLFLSLAFVKRYSELDVLKKENKISTVGRGYHVEDLQQLGVFGTVSGYISVLVLALYLNSNQAFILYRYSAFLWFICLLLLFWVSRIWMLATRGEMHDDPVVFALKDKVSWIAIFMTCLIIIVATL